MNERRWLVLIVVGAVLAAICLFWLTVTYFHFPPAGGPTYFITPMHQHI